MSYDTTQILIAAVLGAVVGSALTFGFILFIGRTSGSKNFWDL